MEEQLILRCLLVLGSLVTAAFVLRRVRKAQVQIEDTIFWLGFSALLLLLSIFPRAAFWLSRALGFQSPINLVYLIIIFVLLVKQFFMTIRISQMDSKLRSLAQKVALNEEKIERERGRAGGGQNRQDGGGSQIRQPDGRQNVPDSDEGPGAAGGGQDGPAC